MHLFPMLLEIALLNNSAHLIVYPDSNYTSHDILHEGSKKYPRKFKKKIRSLMSK